MAKYGPTREAFSVDTDEFRAKFGQITRETIPSLLRQGLAAAGLAIIRDAILVEPRAPHKTGRLWSSQTFEIPADGLEIAVGFNVEYAEKLHEAEKAVNWTLTGSGPKFLSSKLAIGMMKYMEIVAGTVQRGGGGGGTSDIGGLKSETKDLTKQLKANERLADLGWQ